MAAEQAFITVDVRRRWYGQRYTSLPVDAIDQRGLTIDCTDSYMRPTMFDLLPGDVVRWTHEQQRFQAVIAHVERTETLLTILFSDVRPLPSDQFPYW